MEEVRRRTTAAGAARHHRGEAPEAHALQDLLGDHNLLGAGRAGRRRERDADRVADAFLKEHGERSRRGDDALGADARLGKAEVERVAAAPCEHAVDGNEALDFGDLGAQHDAVGGKAELHGHVGALHGALDESGAKDGVGGKRIGERVVLVHHAGEERLIKRAPVDADAHGGAVLLRALNHGGEVLHALLALADVAGIDTVLGERGGAFGMICEQLVAVVVEVAHERDVAAGAVERLANAGDAASGVGRVDGESDELAARARKRKHLGDARLDVGRRGVRHRLHDDRVHAADRHDAAAPGDLDGVGLATEFKGVFRHGLSLREIRTGRRPV